MRFSRRRSDRGEPQSSRSRTAPDETRLQTAQARSRRTERRHRRRGSLRAFARLRRPIAAPGDTGPPRAQPRRRIRARACTPLARTASGRRRQATVPGPQDADNEGSERRPPPRVAPSRAGTVCSVRCHGSGLAARVAFPPLPSFAPERFPLPRRRPCRGRIRRQGGGPCFELTEYY